MHAHRSKLLNPDAILPALGLLVLLAVTVVVYWRGLSGPPILDDVPNLAPLADYGRGILTWQEFVTGNNAGPLGRPISMLTFLANYDLTGSLVLPMKATNLGIHLVCGVLLFFLAGILFSYRDEKHIRPWAWYLALFATALWLLSPMFVGTVLYVIQRMAQLAALFCLAGMLLYVRGRAVLRTRRCLGWTLIGLSLGVCWPLATLSKENGAILPLMLLVTEIMWFRFEGEAATVRKIKWLFALCVGIPAAAFIVVALTKPAAVFGAYAERNFTLVDRVLTESRVLVDYVRVLLFPAGARMGVYHDDFVASRGFMSPPTTLFTMVLWGASIVAAIRWRNSHFGLILFGMMLFLAGQTIESSVFPLELYFEHRNYLPGIGIYISCAVGLSYVKYVLRGRYVYLINGLMIILPLLFAIASYQRVQSWRSWESVILTSAAAHPNSIRTHSDLANLYALHDDVAKAFGQMRELARLDGDQLSAVALQQLIVHCFTHTPISPETRALMARVKKLSMGHYTDSVLSMLADIGKSGTCKTQFKSIHLGDTLKTWYRHSDVFGNRVTLRNIHFYLARIFREEGDLPAAMAHLNDAMALMPHHIEAGLTLVYCYIEMRDGNSALKLVKWLETQDRGKVKRYSQQLKKLDKELTRARAKALHLSELQRFVLGRHA